MAYADKMSLLVVDDDAPIRRLLERVAKRAGFDVDSAKDGIQALEMLARKEYQIAIVDLMMPRLSGYELVQRIDRLDPRPAVIVATAMGSSDLAALDDSLIRGIVSKPFDIEELTRTLVDMAAEVTARRQRPVPGATVAPPEIQAVPPDVIIAPPEAATLSVSPPIDSASTGKAHDETVREDRAADASPVSDELQGC